MTNFEVLADWEVAAHRSHCFRLLYLPDASVNPNTNIKSFEMHSYPLVLNSRHLCLISISKYFKVST